ncbi:two-component system nitrogen regulation sensor histidine kinase NtrY [Breoghania corrubedonensis]|uniref:histidine kinase n=1 Tax=Breoghania corrubedonensis TaxID=665038 RepID=A0A2T5V915_9HYPH|nr:two-component system nitrogen regulation sensor histidine kinase NtrY [Breoghania corrubedonensis]
MTASDDSVSDKAPRRPARGNRMIRSYGLIFMVLSLISIGVTFAVLTGLTPIRPTGQVVWIALATNGVLVSGLVAAIAWEIYGLWVARRRGRAAARLQGRIVGLFSIIAILPAILVAVVATITLDRGLDRWFEERTRSIIDNALTVARAYLQEHARVLRADLIAMANDIDRAKSVYDFEPTRFDSFFEAQASLRGIPAAFLLKSDGTVVTRTVVDPKADILMPPKSSFAQADSGQPVLIAPGVSSQVGGVMKLTAYNDIYLYVTRSMDPRVVDYLRMSQEGAKEYNALDKSRFGVQIAFALVYIGVALVLLLSAIWIGFGFANTMVSPIRRLIAAAGQVSEGNLYVQVPIDRREGDLANLGATFNNMTAQLRNQREALLSANDQIDQRRRFTEAVLAGVTAGVIGIDDARRITLVNRSARLLLHAEDESLLERDLIEALPEIGEIIEPALSHAYGRTVSGQMMLMRGGKERIVNVRVTTEQSSRREHGYVVTLDDITDLVSAQRTSAWADVARRIAHEIKNPLTPIQLSAERIRRRYGKRIETDREVFDQCVNTIVRQVGEIGRMVDEFSSFARMPKPTKEHQDLVGAVREAVFMQTVGHPDVTIEADLPDHRVVAYFDHRLIGQALINVIKNAAEAVLAVPEVESGEEKGRITVSLREEPERLIVDIEDNGIGLPMENRQRLLEPYMTTREKGTGLGLAIVRKIMEDHGGGIELMDAPQVAQGGHGALVRLTIAAGATHDEAPDGAREGSGQGQQENSDNQDNEPVHSNGV